jgi:flagellar protein FlbT
MALKVELKPGERIIVGECTITNADQRTRLLIDGAMPILREKDVLTAPSADTPAKRVYFAVQLMYVAREPQLYHETYFALVCDIVQAAPSTWPFVERINDQILGGNLYKALKEAAKLIAYEKAILDHAERGQGEPEHAVENLKSA